MKNQLMIAIFSAFIVVSITTAYGQTMIIGSDLVIEDSYVQESEPDDTHDGGTAELRISNYGGATIFESYFKFDISNFPNDMDSLVVSVYGSQQTSQTVVDHFYVEVYAIPDNSWKEFSLTWNNKPAKGDLIATLDIGSESAWYGIDVTSFANAQKQAGKDSISIVVSPKEVLDGSYVWFSDKSWRDAKIDLYELPQELSSPEFMPVPGQHEPNANGKLAIELSHYNNAVDIYFTTDGTIPTNSSPLYTEAFEIDSSAQIRAVGFINDEKKTQTISVDYFLGEQTTFKSNPFELPGTLLLTQFDNGGQDIAYFNPKYHEWDNSNAVRGNLNEYRALHSTDQIHRFSGGLDDDNVITNIDATPNMGYSNAGNGNVQWIEYTVDIKEQFQKVEATYWKANDGDAEIGLSTFVEDENGDIKEYIIMDPFSDFENGGFWAHIENRQTITLADAVYFPVLGQQVIRITWFEPAVNLSTLIFSSASVNNFQSTGVNLNKNELDIGINEMSSLIATISAKLDGLSPNDSVAEWKSKYSEIATVSNTGMVRGVSHGTTEVTVRTAFGWVASCTVNVDSTIQVGIDPFIAQPIKIYPNPVEDILHIESDFDNNIISLSLTNILGKTVFLEEYSDSNIQVPVGQLQPGVYIVHIKKGNIFKFTQKILIK